MFANQARVTIQFHSPIRDYSKSLSLFMARIDPRSYCSFVHNAVQAFVVWIQVRVRSPKTAGERDKSHLRLFTEGKKKTSQFKYNACTNEYLILRHNFSPHKILTHKYKYKYA